MVLVRRLGLAPVLLLIAACEAQPASPDGSATPRSATAAGSIASASAPSAASTQPADSARSNAAGSASAAAPAADPLQTPKLSGEDGKTLPQTKDRPSTDSPAFKKRIDLLWQAIVANDPKLADASFFPDVAYELVKDIEKPKADWTHRLMKAFARDIGEYHKQLGPEPKAATFVALDVEEPRVKWIDPGKEGNKVGYYRVTRSVIRYRDAGGVEKKLELTSLISWRGEWFVVHLHGFK